nr:hypothetical protein [Tanacetum cinerariifolium]
MKLTDWVLCEIYKKETDDNKQEVLSARNQHLDELSHRKRTLMHHQGSIYQKSASTLVYQQQLHSTYQDNQSDKSNEDNFSYNYEEILELDYADSLNPAAKGGKGAAEGQQPTRDVFVSSCRGSRPLGTCLVWLPSSPLGSCQAAALGSVCFVKLPSSSFRECLFREAAKQQL